MLWNAGKSYRGPLPPLTAEQLDLQRRLKDHVWMLAVELGARSLTMAPENLDRAAGYIEHHFKAAQYDVRSEEFTVEILNPRERKVSSEGNAISFGSAKHQTRNVIAESIGTKAPHEIVIIGAHYDSVYECPAANDNGSGVAALLELARVFSTSPVERTLRFVAFTNEEPPFFRTEQMGSYKHAAGCRDRKEQIVGMLSLETIGYYTDEPGSQRYPHALFNMLYPATGNFVSFVSNMQSRRLVTDCIRAFRKGVQFPSEGGAVPDQIPGVGFSDQWSFWKFGYPAIMVTDTANYRYPFYHESEDTPEKLNYDNFTRVVTGLRHVIGQLVNGAA